MLFRSLDDLRETLMAVRMQRSRWWSWFRSRNGLIAGLRASTPYYRDRLIWRFDMKNLLKAAAVLALTMSAPACAHEAPIRVVVLGEDSDRNAVSRSSEIYTRVVAELQQSLIRENITVIDEDMIAVKLGFSYNEDRTKQELIQTLSIANETTDATVRSRLGVVFAIFPNIQEMSMTRKLTVRVRGQIYDLKTLRAL